MTAHVQFLFEGNLHIETQLKPSAFIVALLILFGFAAITLVWSVGMSVLLKCIFSLFILVNIAISSSEHLRRECQAVRVTQNIWFLVLESGREEPLDILRISNVLSLGYNLKVRIRSSGKTHIINFWRQHTHETFLRYLSQVKAYGLINTDQV